MNKRYVEVVTNKDLNKIEALNDFCLHNDIENVSKNILASKELSPVVFEDYLAYFDNDKVIDYCFIHGEKDLGRGFLSFPRTLKPRKSTTFVEISTDYAFSKGLDEVSIMTKDNNLKNILDKMGFISLGTYNDMSSYVLGREDKEKGKIMVWKI